MMRVKTLSLVHNKCSLNSNVVFHDSSSPGCILLGVPIYQHLLRVRTLDWIAGNGTASPIPWLYRADLSVLLPSLTLRVAWAQMEKSCRLLQMSSRR